MAASNNNNARLDYRIILEMVTPGARVLDLGCGGGELLDLLLKQRSIVGQGVEIDPESIGLCMGRGVSAIQGDVDEGLMDYPDQSFDFVILNQTLQAVKNPDRVIEEMVRVGKTGIVGFPNFGHYRIGLELLLRGRMPVTHELPYPWYSTPNIHLLTIRDFEDFCEERSVRIKKRVLVSRAGVMTNSLLAGLRAIQAIYQIRGM